MNITIKKLKTWNTTDGGGCNCSVYIDNKYVGIGEDQGFGGGLDFFPDYSGGKAPKIDANGNYVPVPQVDVEKTRKLIADARAFIKSLPKKDYGFGMEGKYEQTLETYIDDLILAEMQKKSDKKAERDFQKGICFGVGKDRFTISSWKGCKTLKDMIDNPNGKVIVQKAINDIKKNLKPGQKILNVDVLKNLGLKV